jgi:hypothetical protein
MGEMDETEGAVNKPQSDTSNPLNQQEKGKESINDKIIPILVSSLLSFLAGYLLHYLTTDEPRIAITVRPASQQVKKGRITHTLTIKNEGKKLVEDVELTIKNIKDKKHESRIITEPPIVSSCRENIINDIFSLKCGDLKPNGLVTIFLEYDHPPININDVELYAKNAISKKNDSNQILEYK